MMYGPLSQCIRHTRMCRKKYRWVFYSSSMHPWKSQSLKMYGIMCKALRRVNTAPLELRELLVMWEETWTKLRKGPQRQRIKGGKDSWPESWKMKMRSSDSEEKHICPEVRMLCSDSTCLVPVKRWWRKKKRRVSLLKLDQESKKGCEED